ncbi:Gibberellin-regulated protein 8 [Abeliophyllum distichum]|uniref:Gibberellin-regulated protein 8 n=1 Tax=Abeliophyllum distichum TaxID=126358 RepID=A0ABD1SFU8_9LAMI
MKHLFFTLFLVSLIFSSSFITLTAAAAPTSTLTSIPTPTPTPTPIPGSCDAMCKTRCAKAGIQKRCLNFCGICCSKCQCVPSGTYGNKSECPCYRDMVNSKGKPKCP